jgi:hypothetical protein
MEIKWQQVATRNGDIASFTGTRGRAAFIGCVAPTHGGYVFMVNGDASPAWPVVVLETVARILYGR